MTSSPFDEFVRLLEQPDMTLGENRPENVYVRMYVCMYVVYTKII